ncbi:MAG: ATP-binding protein [Christensenellaceae bacterium]
MERKIIKIDAEKCNGCALCAEACHEGAIGMVGGKATLLRDDYCDGLGDCLPVCPTGAITFETRKAAAFDKAAVEENLRKKRKAAVEGGCPGMRAFSINATEKENSEEVMPAQKASSALQQWPVQIKLVPVIAPYFENANLLIAADCTAFSHGDFHNTFMQNKITLIGCPKLDMEDYADKLTEILINNNIKSLTVVRMEVPCCGGIVQAVKIALQRSGKMIPWQIKTITTDGRLLEE